MRLHASGFCAPHSALLSVASAQTHGEVRYVEKLVSRTVGNDCDAIRSPQARQASICLECGRLCSNTADTMVNTIARRKVCFICPSHLYGSIKRPP